MVMPAFQTPKIRALNGYPEGDALEEALQLVQSLVRRECGCVMDELHGNPFGCHMAGRPDTGHGLVCGPRCSVAYAPADAGNKTAVLEATANESVVRFAQQHFWRGHVQTNYPWW